MKTGQSAGLRYAGRHYVVLGVLGLLFSGLALRAGYLTVIDSDFLRAQGDARMMRTEPIMAMRGMIRDRNGAPLAVSTPVTSIWMNPRQALAAGTDLNALAAALHLNAADLSRRVQRGARKGFIYVKRLLPPQVAEAVLDRDFPGVYGMTEYRRFYPEAEVTAHILGFTG
ncbi:MAG: penicillin-binding protein 2, partial [Perlucidibaca sp.]